MHVFFPFFLFFFFFFFFLVREWTGLDWTRTKVPGLQKCLYIYIYTRIFISLGRVIYGVARSFFLFLFYFKRPTEGITTIVIIIIGPYKKVFWFFFPPFSFYRISRGKE